MKRRGTGSKAKNDAGAWLSSHLAHMALIGARLEGVPEKQGRRVDPRFLAYLTKSTSYTFFLMSMKSIGYTDLL